MTVGEAEIASAILTVLERQKLMVEGAGAVGVAAAMYGELDLRGKTVCALLSGGNLDVTMLERIITRGLAREGRTVGFSTVLPTGRVPSRGCWGSCRSWGRMSSRSATSAAV